MKSPKPGKIWSDFQASIYTADADQLGEFVRQAYEKWWNEQRPTNPSFDPKTVLDLEGRFQQETFQRLRHERDDKPIVLAE